MKNCIPEINAQRSLLNRIFDEDLPQLKEIFEDIETRRFLPEIYELLDSDDGFHVFVLIFDLYARNNGGYLWGIKYDDKLVGFVAIMDLLEIPTIFYAMHPSYRLCGLMKDALHSVINYLREYYDIKTIVTDVYKQNSISITILNKLGFGVYKEDEEKVYMFKML